MMLLDVYDILKFTVTFVFITAFSSKIKLNRKKAAKIIDCLHIDQFSKLPLPMI
jgi:hypothetical protein